MDPDVRCPPTNIKLTQVRGVGSVHRLTKKLEQSKHGTSAKPRSLQCFTLCDLHNEIYESMYICNHTKLY